jgi:molecular chaperone DnaK (HSP70)
MALFGIDCGNSTSVLAAVSRTGAAVVPTSTGGQSTPTIVSFNAQRRTFGDQARAQRTANSRSTVEGLPSLLGGQRGASADWSPVQIEEGVGGDCVVASVTYRGEDRRLRLESVVGAFLAHLVEQPAQAPTPAEQPAAAAAAAGGSGTPPSSFVLAVPSYYGPVQRQALSWAADIAQQQQQQQQQGGGATGGWTLVDEAVAVVQFYAHERLSSFTPRVTSTGAGATTTVLFVDSGHCQTSAYLVQYCLEELAPPSSSGAMPAQQQQSHYSVAHVLACETVSDAHAHVRPLRLSSLPLLSARSRAAECASQPGISSCCHHQRGGVEDAGCWLAGDGRRPRLRRAAGAKVLRRAFGAARS